MPPTGMTGRQGKHADARMTPGLHRCCRGRRDARSSRSLASDTQQALAWLEAERPGLRAALLLAGEQELHTAAWQQADALGRLWLYHGPGDERLQVSLAGLESARACGDRVAQARMLDQISAALNAAGRPEAAAVRINQA
jgi:hypothetical protein